MIVIVGDCIEEFYGYVVNFLGNLFFKCLDVFFILELYGDFVEFMGVNMDVICVFFIFLEKCLY